MPSFDVTEVVAEDAAVEAILERHHAVMTAATPDESCHVMTGAELRASGARVFRISDDKGTVLGIGALKPLSGTGVELKSMHVLTDARGTGAAPALLERLIETARDMGATEILLETGSAEMFLPARKLYERAGFALSAPFEGYVEDPLSVFMRKSI